MFKYNCLNPISPFGLNEFTDNYEKVEDVNEANGILVRSAVMHEMEFSDKLLCVARAGAGVNNIPLDKCAEKGIVVFNTPGANANGVKELVFAGMLYAARDIVGGINWCLENQDDVNIAKTAEKQKKNYAGTEIKGKKLGVIGLGAIGALVANAAIHMGMEVYGYDPYISINAAWSLNRQVKHITDVNEIYKECDYITIHVPLLDSTKKMVNADAINLMKPTTVLLNFARDLLVDEAAVLKAIKAGKVRKYVSDFPNATTAGQDGCIVIPHLGASTEESEDNCAKMAVKELIEYLENGNVINSVNYPTVDMGPCTDNARVAVLSKNIPGTINKFSAVFADLNINISDFTNKSKGEYAYTLMDVEAKVTDELIGKLKEVDGVIRVRVVKN